MATEKPVEELKADNDKLHHRLDDLNVEMDKMHRNRNKPQGKNLQNMSVELRAMIAKNEQLRRERLRLHGEVAYSDTAQRIAETKNQIGHMKVKIENTKSEILSLENVKRGQQDVVDLAKHSKEELEYIRNERTESTNKFRNEYRELEERVKVDERRLVHQHNRFHTSEKKLKLGLDANQVTDLQATVEKQRAHIEDLLKKVGSLSKECEGDRKKESRKVLSLAKEKEKLEKHIAKLEVVLKEREVELKRSYASTNLAKR